MNVAGNAGFGPMVLGADRGERERRVEHWLRLVGLWEFRARYPYELSGGMQQRLAIVRALCNEPRLLLMDEPFGALDALTREKMQEELHAVWRRSGMTVLFITHSVEEAIYLGTDVVVMSPRPGCPPNWVNSTVAIDMHSGIQTARIVERSSLMNATPGIREDRQSHPGLGFRSTR
jgi:ABC-type nitrate/sulfonate/bicarbonate transport system ATPase subunit